MNRGIKINPIEENISNELEKKMKRKIRDE